MVKESTDLRIFCKFKPIYFNVGEEARGRADYEPTIHLFHIAASLLDRNDKKFNIEQGDKFEWPRTWPWTSIQFCIHIFCITTLVPPIFLLLDSRLPWLLLLAFCIQEKWRMPCFTPYLPVCLRMSTALWTRSVYYPAAVMIWWQTSIITTITY